MIDIHFEWDEKKEALNRRKDNAIIRIISARKATRSEQQQ